MLYEGASRRCSLLPTTTNATWSARFYGFEMKPFHFRLIGYPMKEFINYLDDLRFKHFIYF